MNIYKKSIYDSNNLWNLTLKVVLPAIMVSFMFGVYVFADQVLAQQLIPINGNNYIENLLKEQFGDQKTAELVRIFGSLEMRNDFASLNRTAIFSAISSVGVMNLLVLASANLITSGAAVLYSRAIAEKNPQKLKAVWVTNFYNCILISVLYVVLCFAILQPTLNFFIPNPNSLIGSDVFKNISNAERDLVLEYFNLRFRFVFETAFGYLTYAIFSVPFLIFTNLFVFFIRADGKNYYITFANIFASFVNIFFDFVFFFLLKTNLEGGGMATLIASALNLVLILGYIVYRNNFATKQTMALNFRFWDLLSYKSWSNNVTWRSLSLSMTSFVIDMTNAVANIIYVPILFKTLGVIGSTFIEDIIAINSTPVYNVFIFSLNGLIAGLRPILAYTFKKNEHQKVKKIYYYGTATGVLYGLIVCAIYFPLLRSSAYLAFFNARTPSQVHIYWVLSAFLFLQMPFTAISSSGISLFQSTDKKLLGVLISLIRGALVFYPLIAIWFPLAAYVRSDYLALSTGFTNVAFSALVIKGLSYFYLKYYLGKPAEMSTTKWALIQKNNSEPIFNFWPRKKSSSLSR